MFLLLFSFLEGGTAGQRDRSNKPLEGRYSVGRDVGGSETARRQLVEEDCIKARVFKVPYQSVQLLYAIEKS